MKSTIHQANNVMFPTEEETPKKTCEPKKEVCRPKENEEEAQDKHDQEDEAENKPKYKGTATIRHSRKKAIQEGEAMASMPTQLATLTISPLERALTTVKNDGAYVRIFKDRYTKYLKFEDGRLSFNGEDVTNADLYYMAAKSREKVSEIDIPMLQTLYSLIMFDMSKHAKSKEDFILKALYGKLESYTVTVYARDLIRMMGYTKMQDPVGYLTERIGSFNKIFGLVLEGYDGRGKPMYMNIPVLLLMKSSEQDQTVSFTSPYLNEIVKKSIENALGKDRIAQIMMSENPPKRIPIRPTNSYLINADIMSERNIRAIEIVQAVVVTIEQAGNNTVTIRAKTILERCGNLKQAYDAASETNKTKVLKRAFGKAWELLRTKTKLTEVYDGIELPALDNLPTMGNIETKKYEIKHNGKKNVKNT